LFRNFGKTWFHLSFGASYNRDSGNSSYWNGMTPCKLMVILPIERYGHEIVAYCPKRYRTYALSLHLV
jgi:hypothetical protein